MKKQYRKPEIAIEDFVLNQFIAGSCTVKTNLRDTCYSANYDEWSKELDPFSGKIVVQKNGKKFVVQN